MFIGQRVPVYDADPQQDQLALACIDLQHILSQENHDIPPEKFEDRVCSPISLTELDILLGKLANGKSSGYDQIPNELLKHSSPHFKQYLLAFLNKIIESGLVPQSLNVGKCVLIYKVGFSLTNVNNFNFNDFPGW